MRNINESVEVTYNVTSEKIAIKETIVSYTVNKKSLFLEVRVEFLDNVGNAVKNEDFYFTGDKYRENPSENEIWTMIDDFRNIQQ